MGGSLNSISACQAKCQNLGLNTSHTDGQGEFQMSYQKGCQE